MPERAWGFNSPLAHISSRFMTWGFVYSWPISRLISSTGVAPALLGGLAMAWIEQKQRRDGGVSARVVWRLGGTREGAYRSETFGAGSDSQNLAWADGFKKMVDAAGQRWPDGWVRGGGLRPSQG